MSTAVICAFLPLTVVSTANMREHHMARARRAKLHRETARWALSRYPVAPGAGPVTITLIRIAPRKLDDDNLQSAFKASRDGVADWLGVDDGHPSLTWLYAQRKGLPNQYGAEVVIQWEMTA